MNDAATLAGVPDVRMCDDPACSGYGSCPAAAADRSRMTGKTLGISAVSEVEGTPDEVLVWMLADALACSRPTDNAGRAWWMPGGTEFRVHKAPDGTYTALYSGPCDTLECVFAGAEPFDDGDCDERLKARYKAVRQIAPPVAPAVAVRLRAWQPDGGQAAWQSA